MASIHAACTARSNRYAPGAPEAVATEALVLYAAWLYQSGAQRRNVFPTDQEGPPINVFPRVSVERCTRALGELARPAGGRECDLMRWPPWQSAPVEDRSSLTTKSSPRSSPRRPGAVHVRRSRPRRSNRAPRCTPVRCRRVPCLGRRASHAHSLPTGGRRWRQR